MKHQPPNTSDKRSNKFLRSGSIPPPTTSHGGRYTIRRSGLSIFVVILSSVSIALFTGRMASSYMHRRQQRELQPQCQPAHTMLTEADENIINHEALVHPAMIAHLNPKRVAVVGGKQQDATLREVYKHVSVQDAFILGTEGVTHKEVDARTSFLVMNDQTCSSLLFDVIIDPNPVKVTTYFSPYFNCLDDDGMLALNIDTAITNKDTALGVGRLEVLGGVMDALEEVGYKSVHLYEDESSVFGAGRSFIVALKSQESRAEWYINQAEVDIRLHQRIGRTNTLDFFDSQTMLKYQLPSKAVETAYCQGVQGDEDYRKWECEQRGIDPEVQNVPLSYASVGKSTMGEYSGRGVFATKDIPKGRTIGMENSWLSYFILPSTHRIMWELFDWAEENDDEDYGEEVFESISAVTGFSEGYGFWSSLFGLTHSTVDSSIMMFCNHGCNGTYNLGSVDVNYTEFNVDPKHPPESIISSREKAFAPARERNLREVLTHGDTTNRDIKKGEEVLCNYLEFVGDSSSWEEDVRGLQGQCTGTELGEISAYERNKRIVETD